MLRHPPADTAAFAAWAGGSTAECRSIARRPPTPRGSRRRSPRRGCRARSAGGRRRGRGRRRRARRR
eukprot:12803266-Alexandrium_andersonii.AAC.2